MKRTAKIVVTNNLTYCYINIDNITTVSIGIGPVDAVCQADATIPVQWHVMWSIIGAALDALLNRVLAFASINGQYSLDF